MRNTGPRLTSFTQTPGTSFKESGRAIDVLTDGIVEIIDEEGRTLTYTFTQYDPAEAGPVSMIPYRIEIGFKQVTANTTSDIICLH